MKSIPFAQPRRKDRAVEDEDWIRDLLRRAPVGVLGTSEDGQPYINSNLFAFDEEAGVIYMHTARAGRTRTAIEGNPRVCFGVFEMGRLLPADTALEMSVEYASVVVFGTASVVADAAEAERGLQLLLDKYFAQLQRGRDYRPIIPEELARTAVYRVEIEAWSGKRKQAAAEYPGAFMWPGPEVG